MARDDKARVIAAITRAMKEIAYWQAQTYAEPAAARDLLSRRAA